MRGMGESWAPLPLFEHSAQYSSSITIIIEQTIEMSTTASRIPSHRRHLFGSSTRGL